MTKQRYSKTSTNEKKGIVGVTVKVRVAESVKNS